MTTFCPTVRKDLVPLPEGCGFFDPILNRQILFGPLSQALLPHLGPSHPVDDVIHRVCDQNPGLDRAKIEHTLRTLLLMNVLEGAGRQTLDRAKAVAEGKVLYKPLILEETRFACQGSGDCCQSYVFGPLRTGDVERLRSQEAELQRALVDIGKGPYVEERPLSGEGGTGVFLKTQNQRCIFQRPDHRCGIHQVLGESAKPAMCQLYPYQNIPTLYGRKFHDRGECARYSTSSVAGPLLREDLARIESLLPPPSELYHPLVWIDETTPCDYGYFYPFQELLIDLAAKEIPLPELLRRMGTLLQHFANALCTCPLEAGQPEATLETILAQIPKPESSPESNPNPESGPTSPGNHALLELLSSLRYALAPKRLILQLAKSQERMSLQVQELDAVFATIERQLRVDPNPQANPRDPHFDAVLRRSLRQQLFGDRMMVHERPLAGLLRMALCCLVVQVIVQKYGPESLDAGHSLAMKTLGQDFATESLLALQEAGRGYLVLSAICDLLERI